MTQTFTAERVLEYPGGYVRSVGPVIGRFLSGLRDARILAVRLADGRVLVPPAEYDPTTSAPVAAEGDHWIEVGPRGTVQAFAWVAEPRAGKFRHDLLAAKGKQLAHQLERILARPFGRAGDGGDHDLRRCSPDRS